MMRIFARLPSGMKLGSGRAVIVVIELLMMTYLMRQLGPEPFGLVAMVMSMVIVFEILAAGGFGSSLVSDASASPQRIAAAFFLSVIVALLITTTGLLMTSWVVDFYQDERVRYVWVTACLLVGISSFSSIPMALAQRQKKFALLSWPYVPVHIIAACVALFLLDQRHDFWAIVVYRAVVIVLGLCFVWILIRPVLKMPSGQDVRAVLNFGFGVTISGMLNAVQRNIDDVIIGRVLGSHALGLYTFAYKVLMLPLREIGGLIDKLAYPRLSLMMPNTEKVGVGLAEVVRETAIFSTPFCLAIAWVATDLIAIIFGEAWLEARFPLVVLALLAVVQVPASRLGLAFLVSRKTSEMASWAMLSTPPIVLSFFVGLAWGIDGVVLCYALTSLSLMLPWFRVCAASLGYASWRMMVRFFYGLFQGFLATLPILLVGGLCQYLETSAVIRLGLVMCAGAASWGVSYFLVMRSRRLKGAAW